VSQTAGTCDAADSPRQACTLGQWNQNTQGACKAAGCCWDPQPFPLKLDNSSERQDHLNDAMRLVSVCVWGCEGERKGLCEFTHTHTLS
jgi:hypothetical protein